MGRGELSWEEQQSPADLKESLHGAAVCTALVYMIQYNKVRWKQKLFQINNLWWCCWKAGQCFGTCIKIRSMYFFYITIFFFSLVQKTFHFFFSIPIFVHKYLPENKILCVSKGLIASEVNKWKLFCFVFLTKWGNGILVVLTLVLWMCEGTSYCWKHPVLGQTERCTCSMWVNVADCAEVKYTRTLVTDSERKTVNHKCLRRPKTLFLHCVFVCVMTQFYIVHLLILGIFFCLYYSF